MASCLIVMVKEDTINNTITLTRPYAMTVTMRTRKTDDGKNHRSISVAVGEHGTWWWMMLKLQAFGMKKEGGGDVWYHADLKERAVLWNRC